MRALHDAVIRRLRSRPRLMVRVFDNALRRRLHDPATLFDGLVRAGDTVVDVGCGPGTFTLALAERVGETGRVIALDIRSSMLEAARRRAAASGVGDRIELHHCERDRLGISCRADFVLAFWMVHEVSRPREFLEEVMSLLRPGGRLLIAEPRLHVTEAMYGRMLQRLRQTGFELHHAPSVRFSRAVLCARPSDSV